MGKTLQYLILTALLSGCSTHSIRIKGTHFASPVTSEKLWSGKATLSASSTTDVVLIQDMTSAPPDPGKISFNDDIKMLGLSNPLSVEASLGLLWGADLYLDGTLFGLRWQFLNHGEKTDVWVASVQGATGGSDYKTTQEDTGTSATAETKLSTKQVGASIGYKFPEVVLYASYISESHVAKTNIDNSGTTYGEFEDKGNHHYYSIGVSSFKRRFSYGLEYSKVMMGWGRSDTNSQETVGGRIGFAW